MADVEEMCTDKAIQEQHRLGGGQRRDGSQDEPGGDQRHPGKDRQVKHGHARCPQRHHRDQQIHAGGDRSRAGDQQAQGPVVDSAFEAEWLFAERRIAEPTRIRRGAIEKAPVQDQTTEQEQPVAERVQARKRHVTGADLQRHDVV